MDIKQASPEKPRQVEVTIDLKPEPVIDIKLSDLYARLLGTTEE
jgi:hypothetical protein